MKYFWGFVTTFVILALAVLGTMAIWGIYPVSGEIIWKTLLTIFIVFVAFAILWLNISLFFKKEKHRNDGNNAHLIK
jgi:hypothetical protein